MKTEKLNDKIEAFDKSLNMKLSSTHDAHQFMDSLLDYLFPIRAKHRSLVEVVDLKEKRLNQTLSSLLDQLEQIKIQERESIKLNFFSELSGIFDLLILDAKTAVSVDPAAKNLEEVVVAYPGFYAISVYRVANLLHRLQVPFLPRIFSEYAHAKTGIDIHPGATIGKNFFIDHGTGIVIGETAVIGDEVKIYQGVTIGALQVSRELANKKRHPTIENGVVIYSGATILGGDTVIGKETIVGGNVWLTESVPPYSLVYTSHQVRVRQRDLVGTEIHFVI